MGESPVRRSRFARFFRGLLTYGLIIAGTLVVLDLLLRAFHLFPPSSDYGDPDLGWRPGPVTQTPLPGRCTAFWTGEQVQYQRNEDGIRTWLPRGAPRSDSAAIRIAITGDSHTELCAPNPETHFGYLESDLRSRAIPAVVLGYGAGRYSPLQEYLAYKTVLKPYAPDVLVMNVYTGNDFSDLLRFDDRPHFVSTDSGYRVAPPTWYTMDDPARHPRSPVLGLFRTLFDKVGIRRAWLRFSSLRTLAVSQGKGTGTIIQYVRDLTRAREPSVGYSDAFSAQFLNQQLFFHHFPGAKDESIRRMREVMRMARRENPDLILLMSPIPSYELLDPEPLDSALTATLKRLPVSLQEGVAQERGLYEQLRVLAGEEGWLFVDNLAALESYRGGGRLYNNFDYHILPSASELIGRGEAQVLEPALHARTKETRP